MGSSLTLSLTAHDWPRPTELGVMARDDRGVLVIARSAPLNEPLSVAQYRRVCSTLVQRWFEPELFTDPQDALHDYFEAVTATTP